MPELIPKERLQPALLDRLEDDDPEKSEESRHKRVISPSELHESVKRDLAWLLNTANMECTEDLEEYPEVIRSVLNFGVRDYSGRTVTEDDIPEIQRGLRQAILQFEPRIMPKTLEIEVELKSDKMSHNTLTFFIRADLWANPLPLELYLRTELDLDTGSVTVTESR